MDHYLRFVLHTMKPEVCFIEGASYGSKGNLFSMGMVQGVLRHRLHGYGLWMEVAPSTLKAWACTGKADKAMVLEACREHLIPDCEDHNVADAAWLSWIGWCVTEEAESADGGLVIPAAKDVTRRKPVKVPKRLQERRTRPHTRMDPAFRGR